MGPLVLNINELGPWSEWYLSNRESFLWLPGISLLQAYFYLVVFLDLIFNIYWTRSLFLTALQRQKPSRVLCFESYFAQAALRLSESEISYTEIP